MTPFPRTTAAAAYVIVAVGVLIWDVLLAGQIARARRQARDFLAVTALCGLFVVPAAVIGLASPSALTGRTVAWISWMWPAALGLFVLQSFLALRRRLVTSLISAPLFGFNLLVFLGAVARYATTLWPEAPAALMGLGVAQASALGVVWRQAALWSPWVLQVPLLAPAYPARWRLSKAIRAVWALGAMVFSLIMVVAYPEGVRAVESFGLLANEALRERPQNDLALGVRLFPRLTAPPPSTAIERDLLVADTLGARILSVVVTPSGASVATLDSIGAALAAWRADSALLLVSLGYDEQDASQYATSPRASRDRRLAALDRVVRRLRPDVVVPAVDPLTLGAVALGGPSVSWWMDYHARAAALVHGLRPRTRIAAVASAFTAADSQFYAWSVQERGIDLVGVSFAPTFRGGASIAARQRTVQRWMTTNRKPHWVTSVRSYPFVFGERAQEHAIVGTFAWASGQPRITAVIAEAAGDYDVLDGLTRSDGSWRPVVAGLARAHRALDEAR